KTVAVVSEKANQVQTVWSVGDSPDALLLDPSSNTLYVADYFDSTLRALDASTGVSKAVLSVPSGPTSLALDPAAHLLYVAVNGGSNIVAVDVQTNSVAKISRLISGSYEIGVNPANHVVYVPTGLDELAYYQGLAN
ncbi:MAG: YncE family protein, partial [Acidobacteriota bacterium]